MSKDKAKLTGSKENKCPAQMDEEEDFRDSVETAVEFDSPDELVRLTTSYDLAEAFKIKSFLESEGFQVIATDYDGFEIFDLAAHIDRGVNLSVFSEDSYDAANRFGEFFNEQVEAGGIKIDTGWGACPKCRSRDLSLADDITVEMSPLTYIKSFFMMMRALHCNDCDYEWVTEKT